MDGFPIGQKVQLAGHFNEPVMLEAVRPLGSSYECGIRLAYYAALVLTKL